MTTDDFRRGAQACREMMTRFIEQGDDTATAASIRANWNPWWGADPGKPVDAEYWRLQGGISVTPAGDIEIAPIAHTVDPVSGQLWPITPPLKFLQIGEYYPAYPLQFREVRPLPVPPLPVEPPAGSVAHTTHSGNLGKNWDGSDITESEASRLPAHCGDGFYWIRVDGEIQVAKYSGWVDAWWLTGCEDMSRDVEVLSARLEPPLAA